MKKNSPFRGRLGKKSSSLGRQQCAIEALERRQLLASLQLVPNWGASGVPTTLKMYEYVPDHVAPKAPVMVLCHYWGASAGDVFAEAYNGGLVAAADKYGFIIVVPQTSNSDGTGRGWDANSAQSLKHDGGGETQGIAEMVKYAIATQHADPDRVYVTGPSSGGMMTEALLATYPDVFKAGVEFAGVPAGAWSAGNPDPGGWSYLAATGQVTHTAQEWGDMVRAMDPGYSGRRPRVELWHGTADNIISYTNHTEAIKEWTNVLGLSSTPTSSGTVTIGGHQYTHQAWLDSLGNTVLDAWSETNGGHGTDALLSADYVIPFLGLDRVGSAPLSSAQDSDVGSPRPAGSSGYNPDTDTYTVAGRGAAIGGASDQFHYLSQGVAGDGTISACVTSQTNTSSAAQAGVMFRDSTAANAAYAYAFITPGNQVQFAIRSATGTSATYNATVSAGASRVWVRLIRAASQFTAQYSLDGTNWTKLGTTQTITMASSAQAGLAVSSNSSGTLCTSTFTAVQLKSSGAFSSNLDIGSPSPGGTGTYDVGTDTYTIAGGGADIWGSSDQFHYLSKSFNGNGSITARVNSQTNTDGWAKAGVMFRDGTAANAAFANVVVTRGNGVSFQWRSSTGANCGFAQVAGVAAPLWVRLTRSGSQFAAQYSSDGANWTQLGTPQTVTMATTAQAGLAVTSHNDGTLSTATIDNVLLDTAVPTLATAASASPSTVAGTVASLSVLGADDGGESNLSYTWSLAGTPPAGVVFSANSTNAAKNTFVTFSKAGTYNFAVTITDQGGLSTTGSVSVTVNQTLTGIAVTPGTANLVAGRTQQFSAVAFDQFGNAMATQPTFTWTLANGVGSVNSSGLYTASSAGAASVRATSGSISALASVNVVTGSAAPTVAKAASASSGPVTGTTTTLSVLGADDAGESNLTYTWSLTGTPPGTVTFSANGTNAAKNTTVTFAKAGTYNFTVVITDQNGRSTTSSVAVPVTFGLFNNSRDIGSPALAGSFNFDISNASYTLTAGGADVWGTSDQFGYACEAFSGNGQFTARVTSVSNSNASAKAGLMFRDSAAADAAYAFVWVSPGNNVQFDTRASNGASSKNSVAVSAGGSPVWVRLVRSGSQFTASYSRDGSTWTQVGTTQTLTMATTAQAGLAVCSHNTAALNTSVMDNVTLSGLAMRGRPTLNAARTTFVADNGQLLRGPFTSTEWTGAIAESDLAMIKNMGFNAVHLYGESFDKNYPNAGSTAPGYAAARTDQIVQEAQNLGLYVVLTIGNGAFNGDYNRKYIEDFWKFYAPRYANNTNVLFEVQNEPVAWGPPYSNSNATPPGAVDMEVSAYNIIRTYAPNTPVLLFTYAVLYGGASAGNDALQDIHAFNQKVFGNANATWTNEAVAFHGYAGAQFTAEAVQTILNAGYPAFMTEFTGGTWAGRYDGLDVALTASLEQMNVSWMTFEHIPPSGVAGTLTDPNNFVDPVEATGLGWNPDYGNWPALRGTYGNNGFPWATTSTYVNNQLTGTLHIEAENYDSGGQNVSYYDTTSGNQGGQYRTGDSVDIITTTDTGGGYAITSTANGEYLEYTINVQQPGYYNLVLRYSNATSGAAVDVSSQFVDLSGYRTLPTTGSLTNWSTFTTPIFLGQGRQVLQIGIPVGGFNLNWLELTPVTASAIANGTYLLVNRNSGQAMQFDTTNNVVVQQPATPGSNLQQWVLQNLGAGQYKVTSAYNSNSWNSNGGNDGGVRALGMSGGWGTYGSQMYILQPTGDGFYTITTVDGGYNLDIQSGSVSKGAGVVQDKTAPGANQQWAIIGASDQVFPGGLVAFRDNAGKVQLSWSAAPGAAGYNVKRSTIPGGPYTTVATNVTGTSYVDDALQNTAYYYVVSAVSPSGKESLNSLEVGLSTPQAQLTFNDGTGTTALDSTGNGWNGTLQDGAAWSSGLLGGAVSLNGSGAYVSLPTGVVNGLTDFTISTWVNLASNPSWSRIFDFGTGTSNYMFLSANPANSNQLRFAISNGSSEQEVSGGSVAIGAWTHVAVTMTGGVATIYVNGQAVASASGMTLNPSSLGATNQNYLGKSQFGNDPYFNGKIDDFRIFPSGLSSGQIASLYQAGLAPSVAVAASASPAVVTGTIAQLSALGSDDFNQSFLKYTWSLVNPPAPVTFSDNATNTAKNTTVTFSAAGTYSFLVSITDISGLTESSAVTVTVNQTLTGITTFTPMAAGTAQQFSGSDQFGKPMAVSGISWSASAGSITSSGVFTAPTSAGSVTITASKTGFNVSTTVAIIAAAPWYKADQTSGTTLLDSSGQAKNASLTGSYSFTAGKTGNALSLAGGYASLPSGIVSALSDFTIAAWVNPDSLSNWMRIFDFGTGTDANMFLTPSAGGTNALRFAITTGGGGSEQQIQGPAISTGTWTHIAVTLVGTTGTLYVNGVAVGTNTNMTINPSSLGATTQNYLGKSQYNDPAFLGKIDDFRIYGSGLSASAVAAIYNAWQVPTVATAAAATPSPATGTTTNLSVLGADDAGEANLSYTWSCTSKPSGAADPSFGVNGTNAAKNSTATFSAAGSYTFLVTITDAGGLSTTSSVSVSVNQTLASIAVTPDGASVSQGATRQFTATGYDQFGAVLATQPSVIWSSTGGSFSTSTPGLWTAGTTTGTYSVNATSGGISGSASVRVVDTTAAVLVSAGSVKSHGSAGSFEIPLNLSGNAAVECRANGPTQLVVRFNEAVTLGSNFTLGLSSGTGQATVSGSTITISMSGATDGQLLCATLSNVSDLAGNLGTYKLYLAVLLGDVNGNGSVTSQDMTVVKNNDGKTANAASFRADLNCNGTVTSQDMTVVKNRDGRTVDRTIPVSSSSALLTLVSDKRRTNSLLA